MNILRKLSWDLWVKNTLRGAHRDWQAREERFREAQRQLEDQCRAALREAEDVQVGGEQGILKAARLLLYQPLDPATVMAKARLQQAFTLLGQSPFRRLPALLEVALSHYGAALEQIGRSLGELTARLRLAREMLRIFATSPEFCRPRYLRLAILDPESARLLFLLRRKRHKTRHAIEAQLAKNSQLQEDLRPGGPDDHQTPKDCEPPADSL